MYRIFAAQSSNLLCQSFCIPQLQRYQRQVGFSVFSLKSLMTEASSSKRIKTMPKIGTHSGSFHADEALACFLLHHTDEYKNAEIIRSRDPAVLDTLDILVDVGAVFDPEKKRFDHHQRGFTETFDAKHTIKLSSAGLIYKYFGRDILKKVSSVPLDEDTLDLLHKKLYDDLIEGLDGIDNGVQQYPADIRPAYKDSTNLSARVGKLNPMWNETGVDIDAQFAKAMAIAGEEFMSAARYITSGWLPARSIVVQALTNRQSVDKSGRIIVLSIGCPWKDHIFQLEQEHQLDSSNNILFAVFPDDSGAWRVQGVPEHPGSFECRIFLPEPWRGVRDEALSSLTGISGCIFAHANGFIGGNKTKEGALEMASKTLELLL